MKPITELDDSTVMGLQSVELGVLIDKRGKVKVWTKRVRWLDRNTARDQALKVLGRYTAEKSPTDDLLVTANERAAKSMGSLAARFKAVVAAHGGPKT